MPPSSSSSNSPCGPCGGGGGEAGGGAEAVGGEVCHKAAAATGGNRVAPGPQDKLSALGRAAVGEGRGGEREDEEEEDEEQEEGQAETLPPVWVPVQLLFCRQRLSLLARAVRLKMWT